MSSRRRTPLSPTLFPFLAVLVCTLGTMILLLALVATDAQEEADKMVAEESKAATLATEEEVWEAERLIAYRDSQTAELQNRQGALAHLEDHIRRLRDQLNALRREVEAGESDASSESLQSQREEIAKRQMQIDRETARIAELRKNQAGRPPRVVIVPHRGQGGTDRRPIYIECTDSAIVIQSEGVRITAREFEGPLGPGNPLDAALRAVRSHWQKRDPEAPPPYPLLLVRPDGIHAYAIARSAMETWDDQFGYELIPKDLELAFPDPDPTLKSVIAQAVDDAVVRNRARNLALRRARPGSLAGPGSLGGPEGSPVGTSSLGGPAGSATVESSQTGTGSSAGSLGAWGDAGLEGPGNSSLRGPNPRSELALGSGEGSPGDARSGLVGGQEGSDAAGSGPGAGQLTAMPVPKSTLRGPESASGGSASGGSGLLGGGSDGEATEGIAGQDASLAGRDEGALGAAEGDGSGTGSGGGSFAAAGGIPAGDGADPARAAPSSSLEMAGPSTSGPGGVASPGMSGSSANFSSSADMESAQTFSEAIEQRREQAMERAPAVRPNGMPPPLSSSNNWALPDTVISQRGATIVRTLRAQCHADRLILLPEGNKGAAPREFFIEGNRTREAVHQLGRALRDRIATWGPAMQNGRWAPVLRVQVAPDAEERFVQLQEMMENSGVKVEREIAR